MVFLTSLFISLLALAQSGDTDIQTGKVSCRYIVSEAQGCDLAASNGFCGDELFRSEFEFPIMAPLACVREPMFCEGGSVHSGEFKGTLFGAELLVTFNDENMAVKIDLNGVAAFTDSTQFTNSAVSGHTVAVSLLANGKSYGLFCDEVK